jgi:hypothetical protein
MSASCSAARPGMRGRGRSHASRCLGVRDHAPSCASHFCPCGPSCRHKEGNDVAVVTWCMPEREALDPGRALPPSFFACSLHGTHGGLAPLPGRPPRVTPVAKRRGVGPGGGGGLRLRPHRRRGPLTKPGAQPPGQTSSTRDNGALLAPGRRSPVASLLAHRVTGPRAPGEVDEPVTDTPGALTAQRTAPHGGPRRIRAGRQPRGAAQRPLVGNACQVAQVGRPGPGGALAKTRDAPIPWCDLLLRVGLVLEQAAPLEELACGNAPRLSPQRPPHAQRWRQRRRGHLPSRPVTEQAPTGRGDQTHRVPRGLALAGKGGAVFDTLRAGARAKPGAFLCCRGDREASHATVSQVDGLLLGGSAVRRDLLVGCHHERRGSDAQSAETRCGEYAVQHEGCKPRLGACLQRGPREPTRHTGRPTSGLGLHGRGWHDLCVAHAWHRLRFLGHLDSHVPTLTGLRAAWLCQGVFLAREYSQRVTTRSPGKVFLIFPLTLGSPSRANAA